MKNTLTPEWKEAQKMMARAFSELAYWIYWDLQKRKYYWHERPCDTCQNAKIQGNSVYCKTAEEKVKLPWCCGYQKRIFICAKCSKKVNHALRLVGEEKWYCSDCVNKLARQEKEAK